MKVNRWFGIIVSMVLLLSVVTPMGAFAEEKRTLQDESIYDLLIDRYNNGDYENDEDVDPKDMNAFSGGDFHGISSRVDFIVDMGFTLVSIGPVFKTATYEGNQVLDYEELEPHFGTEKELIRVIEDFEDNEVGVIADFPFNGVSEDHVWVKDARLPSVPASPGTVDWDVTSEDVKSELKDVLVSFVNKYELSGIRLTQLGDFDVDYLNEVIAAVKAENPSMYVFSNEASLANFDTVPNFDKVEALQKSYDKFDPDSSSLAVFETGLETDFIQLDDLMGERFTYKMMLNRMFPPTRWKLAAAALFTLPGVPVMTYGTEIAMNGEKPPESHQYSNFKTDMELYDLIADLNYLRNESEALRIGDFDLLKNEKGFTVFKRSSDEETWIVALNNTTSTQNFEIPHELIGDTKRLRGVLDGNSTLESDDGQYNIVLEREVAEIYIVEEHKGFNTPYLIASILVFVFFLGFIFLALRRGKRGAGAESVK